MTPAPDVLVIGATGSLGGATLAALRERGRGARVLVRRRRPDLVHPLTEQVVGDLGDAASVRAALVGIRAAFYVSPHEEAELAYARRFVEEAERAGVRVVFAGVHATRRTLAGRLEGAVVRRIMPHYRGKLAIGALIEREATDAVLLTPTAFFQNDELFLEDIAAGVYPAPLKGFSMVSTADVGAVAARALLEPGFPPGTHRVVGPRSMTGAEVAAAWSRALGRPVRHTGDDAAAWARTADLRLAAGRKGEDYRGSFAGLGRHRLTASAKDVARTAALLGRPPQDYADWAAEVVAAGRVPVTAPTPA
ncbi:SDR family oxidoreductase [Amnibacterium endophyticum]|uniref:SDR family oxidoreductase n=1 Tax=Amnibacterium endophyticum TaxID=2109337 RepID=A0ABW4LG80_9MICO